MPSAEFGTHDHNWHFYKLEISDIDSSLDCFYFICDYCGKCKSVLYAGGLNSEK